MLPEYSNMPSIRFAVQNNHAYLLPTLLLARFIQRREEQPAIGTNFQDSQHLATPDTYLEYQVKEESPIRNASVVPHLLQEYSLVDSCEGPVYSHKLAHTCKRANCSFRSGNGYNAQLQAAKPISPGDRLRIARKINARVELPSHATITHCGGCRYLGYPER